MNVEPSVRGVVADRLGVSPGQLGDDVSLRDELAADSLDLVDLALALEAEFAIVLPGNIVERMRSYGDVVAITSGLVAARHRAEASGAERPVRIWTRLLFAGGESAGSLDWTGWLTPYAVEMIEDDAVRAGRGARLEVTVGAGTEGGVTGVRRQFARLLKRGVQVTVQSGDATSVARGARAALHAAAASASPG